MQKVQITLKSVQDVRKFVNEVTMVDFDVDLEQGRYIVAAKSTHSPGIRPGQLAGGAGLRNTLRANRKSAHKTGQKNRFRALWYTAQPTNGPKKRKFRAKNGTCQKDGLHKEREESRNNGSDAQVNTVSRAG